MVKNFGCENYKDYLPIPVYDDNPEYTDLYYKTWELAYKHIRFVDGMPQSPYMDEAFCDTQLWIWDSCFMALFCKYAQSAFPGVETLKNFYDVLYNGKKLPKIIPGENEPEWTGATPGKPFDIVIHIADNPPLFAWAEYENALFNGDKDYLKYMLYEQNVLQKHYEWIENLKDEITPEGVKNETCLVAEKIGYKWEGGRSGMDNTPRGRRGDSSNCERPDKHYIYWLDAICQQALSAKLISKMYKVLDDKHNEKLWLSRFEEKKNIVNDFYWDSEDKFYFDIDCDTHKFCKVMTIASYWTLVAEIADSEKAEYMKNHLFDDKHFGGFVPLTTLSRSDADYRSDGTYWRGSVWMPTGYVALKGLANYGYYSDAHIIADKVLNHILKTYKEYCPHTIWECYCPEDFKPAVDPYGKGTLVRPDFCGWSALGPISIYIEFLLGFNKVDAFTKIVEWAKPANTKGEIGIKNLRFGDIVTDIVAKGNECTVISNDGYTLKINGIDYTVLKGENKFVI